MSLTVNAERSVSNVTNWVSEKIASYKGSENGLVSGVAKLVFSKWSPYALVGLGCTALAVKLYKDACNKYDRKASRAIAINDARDLVIQNVQNNQKTIMLSTGAVAEDCVLIGENVVVPSEETDGDGLITNQQAINEAKKLNGSKTLLRTRLIYLEVLNSSDVLIVGPNMPVPPLSKDYSIIENIGRFKEVRLTIFFAVASFAMAAIEARKH